MKTATVFIYPVMGESRLSLLSVSKLLSVLCQPFLYPTKAALEPLSFPTLIIYSSNSHQDDIGFWRGTNNLSVICGNRRWSWIPTQAEQPPRTGKRYQKTEIERRPHISHTASHLVQNMTALRSHMYMYMCREYRRGFRLSRDWNKRFLYAARLLKKITI